MKITNPSLKHYFLELEDAKNISRKVKVSFRGFCVTGSAPAFLETGTLSIHKKTDFFKKGLESGMTLSKYGIFKLISAKCRKKLKIFKNNLFKKCFKVFFKGNSIKNWKLNFFRQIQNVIQALETINWVHSRRLRAWFGYIWRHEWLFQ